MLRSLRQLEERESAARWPRTTTYNHVGMARINGGLRQRRLALHHSRWGSCCHGAQSTGPEEKQQRCTNQQSAGSGRSGAGGTSVEREAYIGGHGRHVGGWWR